MILVCERNSTRTAFGLMLKEVTSRLEEITHNER
jgi:hypothetical protein